MASKTPSAPRKPRQAPARTPGQPAPIGDNSAFREEEERIQLISIVAKLSQADIQIEAAKVPLKAAQDARKKIVGLGKAAGFTAAELNKRLEEMANPARDNPEKFAREERHRKWLGIINPEQAELQMGDKVPPEAKDEAHWRAEGFKAGLRQISSTPPTECPERFVQVFMKEHERGYKETAMANVPGQKGLAAQVAAQAAKDFAEDEPEVDLDAAARKLKNSDFMERGPAEEPEGPKVGDTVVTSDEDGKTVVRSVSEGDDAFEATAEELAAQAPRRAIQEAADGETSGGEVV